MVRDGPRPEEHRHHLDGTQYTARSIARYERVFGDGFISTGGLETTKVGRGGGGAGVEAALGGGRQREDRGC